MWGDQRRQAQRGEGNELQKNFLVAVDREGNITENWSQWDSLKSVTLSYLDDGDYKFHIKSRYTTDVEETPIIIDFKVDAITGPALRVYPLYQQVQTGESCDFYIYVEDADSLAGIELNLTYSSVLLTFNSLTQGASLSNASIFLDKILTWQDIFISSLFYNAWF